MAMRGVNKVILLGNLGADPEVRYFPSGDAVANVNLATSETWKDKNTGEAQERTEWHRVQFVGKIAEVVKQYLHKGSKVYLEGKLRTRKWQDKTGQERYTTEIVVDRDGTMQMLDPKGSGSFDDQPRTSYAPKNTAPSAPTSAPNQPQSAPRHQDFPPEEDFDNSEIPF